GRERQRVGLVQMEMETLPWRKAPRLRAQAQFSQRAGRGVHLQPPQIRLQRGQYTLRRPTALAPMGQQRLRRASQKIANPTRWVQQRQMLQIGPGAIAHPLKHSGDQFWRRGILPAPSALVWPKLLLVPVAIKRDRLLTLEHQSYPRRAQG